jgi:hypothetical protein
MLAGADGLPPIIHLSPYASGARSAVSRLTCGCAKTPRYGVNANLLFTWRRRDARSATRGGAEPFELLPVRVSDKRGPAAPVEASARAFVGRMEIVLAAGKRILLGADVDTAAFALVVKALSRR